MKAPEIPWSVSFHKRVQYTHILKAIGKDGNYRSNIDNQMKPVSISATGHYLQEMRKLGLIEREIVKTGRKRGWIGIWRWCRSNAAAEASGGGNERKPW